MPEIELSTGTIDYRDSGGDGPVIVLTHGLLMDGSLWDRVVSALQPDFRCVLPTLPLGGHRTGMRRDADLSMRAIARLLGEFLERLDLEHVTLAINDWGGPLLMLFDPPGARIARLMVTSCEAYDNVPPGLPGRMLTTAALFPGGIAAAMGPMRVRALRRTPLTWGPMSKRAVPDAVMDEWLRPILTQAEIRRDLRKYLRHPERARAELLGACEGLAAFERPTIIAWAAQDKVMPPSHGRRLAETIPSSRLVELADCRTLIPQDRPEDLAELLRELAGPDVPAGRVAPSAATG